MKAVMRKGRIYLTAESEGEVRVLAEIFNNLHIDQNTSRLWIDSIGGKPTRMVLVPHKPLERRIWDIIRELPDWEFEKVAKAVEEERLIRKITE
jgi:hypothetical protein